MIVLTILNADGSTYWVEHFDTMAQANAWLSAEQAKPYWSNTFTYSFVDNTATVAAAQATVQAALQADQADTNTKRQALRALLPANIATLADVKAALVVIHAFLKKM